MSKLIRNTEGGYDYHSNKLDEDKDKSLRIRIISSDVESVMDTLKRIVDMLDFGVLSGKGLREKTGADFDWSIRDITDEESK